MPTGSTSAPRPSAIALPFEHAPALAREIHGAELLPVEHMGYEYFPPDTWDVVVPAILRHTA
jgi:hypothetical protein